MAEQESWKNATVHVVPPSAEELQAKANREESARAAKEHKPERFLLPRNGVAIEGYPLLCIDEYGDVVLTREITHRLRQHICVECVDDIRSMISEEFTRETIEQAAWYLIHEIAGTADITLDT